MEETRKYHFPSQSSFEDVSGKLSNMKESELQLLETFHTRSGAFNWYSDHPTDVQLKGGTFIIPHYSASLRHYGKVINAVSGNALPTDSLDEDEYIYGRFIEISPISRGRTVVYDVFLEPYLEAQVDVLVLKGPHLRSRGRQYFGEVYLVKDGTHSHNLDFS